MTAPVIIIANSLVSRGRVGARAQLFALERLGFEPWILPTVIMPHHPGHGPVEKIVPGEMQFRQLCTGLAARGGLSGVKAIVTGYLGATHQIDPLLDLIAGIRLENTKVPFVCDPVIGDESGLYVSEDVALAMLEKLVPSADVITPNRHELSWLTGHHVETNTDIIEATSHVASETVLVTSAHAMMRGNAANLLCVGSRAWLAEARASPDPPHGPGDLIAALLVAGLLSGHESEKMLSHATAATHDVLAATPRDAGELALVEAQDHLVRPGMPVSVRTLATR